MMHLLATTRSGHEFAVADALNAMTHRPDRDGDLRSMGITAFAPRTLLPRRSRKLRKHIPTDVPAVPQYLFISLPEAVWHKISWGFWVNMPDGKRTRGRVYKVCDIPQPEWAGVQKFADEIELDYQQRWAEIEDQEWEATRETPRKYLAPYSVEDKLHLLGLDMQARFKRSLGTWEAPMIEAEVTMFGRDVTVKVAPDQVRGMAAE